jgi:two-component system OmpR family sensor kinase
MLRSLRSRLLLSHFAVILVALLIVTLALFAFAARRDQRYGATLQELDLLSRATRVQLARLQSRSAGREVFLNVLDEIAANNNVRVLITTVPELEIIYDSETENSWQGQTLAAQELSRRFIPTADPNTVAGLYTAADGSRWLVYSRAISTSGFGEQALIYAAPEPRPFSFLRNLGLGTIIFRAGMIALALSVLLAFLISRSVAKPLQQMAGAAEAIAGGDYHQQLVPAGPEEVQRVAESFNSMSAQVAAGRQAQRDFVANVSHDLKTPLTSIRGWSQALLDGTASDQEAQQRAATVVYNEAERMTRMVEQLLDLAKIESGQLTLQREPLDLAQLLTTVHHNLQVRAAEKGIHFTLETEVVPLVSGDRDRLMQVVSNLVDNALSHTPANGRVHLRLHSHAADKAVEIQVQDTGRGMTPEELSRIFERFYQVEKSRAQTAERKGSGLGLAIVQELVALHHGRVLARSIPGKGSLFTVRLPAAPGPQASTIIRRS